MFFDSVSEIETIARKCGTAVFVAPKDLPIEIKGAIVLQPEEKTIITIEQVRSVLGKLNMRQREDTFVVIRPADLLGLDSANALLKSLEEPGEKIHFVLITDAPSRILPTIMSRASLYLLRDTRPVDGEITASDTVKDMAKRLLTAKGGDLIDIVEGISKKKVDARDHALEVIGTAIEMIYKSYFVTQKEIFLTKLPQFLNAYEGVMKNGNIKLQIVANLC